eukprot:scaffold14276_cov75-Attheya_sp.AAC.3
MSDAGGEKETDVAMEEAPSDEEVVVAAGAGANAGAGADAEAVANVAPSGAAALLAIGSPPGASPPGMKLRSGKKKRRHTDNSNSNNNNNNNNNSTLGHTGKRIRTDSMSSTESSLGGGDPIATGSSAPTGRASLAPIVETAEESKTAIPEPLKSPEPGAAAATKFASAAALLASGARFARRQHSPHDDVLAQAQLASDDTPEQQPNARRLVWASSPPP